jgi:hypothetical protein
MRLADFLDKGASRHPSDAPLFITSGQAHRYSAGSGSAA